MRFIDDFVDYCRDFTGCPTPFLRWSALLAISAIAGDDHVHRRGDWDVRPNLWVLLLGNSSSYKSAGLNAARRLISATYPSIIAAQEYSHEALIEDLALEPHKVFYYDEAHSYFAMLESTYNKGKMKSAMMSLYNRIPIKRKIKGKEGAGEVHEITNAYVCWGGASTPVQITDVLAGKTTDLLSGLFPRFVMVPYFGAETTIEDPPPASYEKRMNLINQIKTLKESSGREYVYSQEALQVKHDWLERFNKRANSSDTLISAFYRKMRDEHFHKITMLSAFARGSHIMDVEDLKFTIPMLWDVEREWKNMIERITEKEWDRDANRVEHFIQKQGICDRADILRTVRGIRAQKLSSILDGLKQDQKIDILPPNKSTGGRPKVAIKWLS